MLAERGASLFSKRVSLLSLWNDMALNFYIQRANFTYTRSLGQEFAAHLSTSHPLIVHRDLTNSLGTVLRSQQWFSVSVDKPESMIDNAGRQWLEAASKAQRFAMEYRGTKFSRATKECDADYVAFGNGVMSIERNRLGDKYLFRTWHLRDCAWSENAEKDIALVVRKAKMTASDLVADFPNTAHPKVVRMLTDNNGRNRFNDVETRHFVVRSDEYESPIGTKWPFVSVWLDVGNQQVMEEIGIPTSHYIVPRWWTDSETQYAVSLATVVALPDGRLLQAMARTLLRVGEKTADPPLIATEDVIRSDMQMWPGGQTWIDRDYDETQGAALRYLEINGKGLPVAFNQQADQRQLLGSAFFIDKLSPPELTKEMTAYETSQLVKKYVRESQPLFDPIVQEYNAPLCENAFEIGLRSGLFGPPQNIPESLQGADIQFKFKSPIVEAEDQILVQTYTSAVGLSDAAGQHDPVAGQMIDHQIALRDVYRGAGVPARWVKSEDQMKAIADKLAQDQQAQKLAQTAVVGGQAAQQIGAGVQSLAAAGKEMGS